MKPQLGINESQRQEMIHELNKILANTALLYLKTHSFHWNVEGPLFNTLHEMFMIQYTEMWNALDEIAERVRALGSYAPGSYAEFIELSEIKESRNVPRATEMIQQLISGHEIVIQLCRKAFKIAETNYDQASCDLLTRRMQIHEKTAWMLRSLLKD